MLPGDNAKKQLCVKMEVGCFADATGWLRNRQGYTDPALVAGCAASSGQP
jgi:hypothetical protein